MKTNLNKVGLTLSSLFLLNTTLLNAETQPTSIDALIIYSQGVEDESNGDAETKINHFMATTNKIYNDSGLNITLNSVKIQKVDLDDSASTSTVLGEVQQNTGVNTLRDSVGADEVIIYRPYANDGLCGLAYYNDGYEAYAYAHVTSDCAGYVTAHEVGHNMHLAHSAKQDPDAGYNRGHGVEDQFTTVMAYAQAYNGEKIYKFSDPDLDCNGEPCGIEAGLENEADAVKEIIVQAPVIANFREHIVIDDTNDTNDTNNKVDNNNSDDTNNDLEAAKIAYEAQILVRDAAKAEVQNLRATLKNVRATAKTNYQTKVQEARSDFKSKKATARETLSSELSTLKAQYLSARADRKAKKITADQFKAIVAQIRAERTTKRAIFQETVTTLKATLKGTIETLKEERKESITEAKTALSTYRTDVYLVEVAKLKALRKAYNQLLKTAN